MEFSMHWFDTKFEKWVRTGFLCIALLLGVAGFVYIFVGSWGFDLDINVVYDWFMFTCMLFLGLGLILVILKAIIVFFTFPCFGKLTFVPAVILGLIAFFFLITLAVVLGYCVLGYPLVDIRQYVVDLINKLLGNGQ